MYVLGIGDTAYVLGIFITTLGGIVLLWLKVANLHSEVKSPNGQRTGKNLYDVKEENKEIKSQTIEIKQDLIDMKDVNNSLRESLEGIKDEDKRSHQAVMELLRQHQKDDDDRFNKVNESLVEILRTMIQKEPTEPDKGSTS